MFYFFDCFRELLESILKVSQYTAVYLDIFIYFSLVDFKLYNLVNGEIVSDLSLPSFGTGSAAMLDFLKTARADVLICGGITGEARRAVVSAGLASYPGFGGKVDDLARAFATGSLQQSEGECPHHSHSH